ncbi:MAG: phage portal protein [Salinimicrobium sediminis]|nr:phage portal protein [Salinimicrobium sediminis]
MQDSTQIPNNLPESYIPPKLGIFTKILLATFPKYGMERLKAKAQVNWLTANGYITPDSNKRSMRDWYARGRSADVDTLPALKSSRAGSRDLYMNTPIATAALRRKVTNVVGSGLNLQSRINREFLGLTPEQAEAWERKTEQEFKLWANSKNCDATRSQTFNELQQMVFLNKMLSGDVFVLLPFRRLKNFPYSLTLQVLEGDQCETPDDISTSMDFISDRTRAGIEIDSFGAPVKYWFRTKHPGDVTSLERKWVSIKAFGPRSGRRQVLHLFNKERPGQRRGMPELAPVMEKLKMISRLDESELMAAVISSYFTVFIKKTTGITQPFAPSFTAENSVKNPSDPQDDFNQEMAPGAMITLADDESIDIADPKRPNGAYEPFFQTIVKEIGAALEVPFELLMLMFNSSYSASRAAILEGWKTFRKERVNFVSDFNQPVYEEWLAEGVLRGRISAPGFFADPLIRQAWSGAFWGGPGMGQIDPKKETEAALLRVNGNLSNYETESQDINGGDWDGAMDRRSREETKLEELGLNQPSPVMEDSEDSDNSDEDENE